MSHNAAERRNAETLTSPLTERPPVAEATTDDVVDWFDLDPDEREKRSAPDELACLSLTSVGCPECADDRADRWM